MKPAAMAPDNTRSGCRGLFAVSHPLFFSVFFVLSFYSANAAGFGLDVLPIPALLAGGSALLLLVMFRILMRNWHVAACLTTLLVVLNFLYGYAHGALGNIWVEFLGRGWGPNSILLPIWLLILAVGATLIVRRRAFAQASGALLALLGACLVATSSAATLFQLHSRVQGKDRTGEVPLQQAATGQSADASAYPDIFYVVLDAYGRQDVLAEHYGFDNRPFLDALEERGFFVADQACANYSQTVISQASTLNMIYLDDLATAHPESTDRYPLMQMLKENAVCGALRELGYSFVEFPSGYYMTENITKGFTYESGSTLNEFAAALLRRTWIAHIIQRFSSTEGGFGYGPHVERLLTALNHLPDATNLGDPVFAYAHLVCPHPPFVFSADGSTRHPMYEYHLLDGNALIGEGHDHTISLEQYRSAYVDQATYLNSELIELVDEVISNARRPTIILLQGDHGPRSGLDWWSVEHTDLREAMGIFSAYYFSEGRYDRLSKDVSPVNSFRVILSQYFGFDLPPLPNRSFFSLHENPYQFHEYIE